MTTTLITGANKGLGKETARRLIASGHIVYIGARNESRGRAAARELGGRFVHLEVTDDASVRDAAERIEADGGLDVLINNAGIEPRLPDNGIPAPLDTTADDMRTAFETNVFGVVRTTHAFLPLLQRSDEPVIVNVSSGLASLADLSDPESYTHFYPGISYPASKATVNAITIQYAKAFPAIRVNAVDPGYTNTDLNGRTGTQTVEEGAEIIVRMAQIASDGPTGTFSSVHGPVAW
ncbi:SDR family NAD(P)-dependent oxidoreductase [Paramicrobacterium chengjingii]|uniref:SDR family NAD(P)-dependent oxidoreductase n=1 Tax=Paramicrobacterium chengjingii TaxID=2769067 RepID=A0ABX6YI86_9MICO|nr:SDR family NAD(P)-dependent oxidoreductase [Microbacterium chengjingii]QPZ38116.1 SDR family NAD(P)-dependent oxidoreductase [Microbacterium chengjingii]